MNDTNQMDATADRIRQLLRREHNLKNGQDDDFKVQTASQFTDSFKSILDMLTLVLGGIVGVSLLVGGIGIMNIMLVSVTERTREIGILKSLGARRSDILVQFLHGGGGAVHAGRHHRPILGYAIGSSSCTPCPPSAAPTCPCGRHWYPSASPPASASSSASPLPPKPPHSIPSTR